MPAMKRDDAPGEPGGHSRSLYTRWRKPLQRMLARYFKSPADIEDAS